MQKFDSNGFVVFASCEEPGTDERSQVCRENSLTEMTPRRSIVPSGFAEANRRDMERYIQQKISYIRRKFDKDRKVQLLTQSQVLRRCLIKVWYEEYSEKMFFFLLHTISSKSLSGCIRILLTESGSIEKQCRILEDVLGISNNMLFRDLKHGDALLWKLCREYYNFKNPASMTKAS